MKVYYYFLYRLYSILKRDTTKNEFTVSYLLTSTSTLIVYFSLFVIMVFVDLFIYKIENQIMPNGYYVVLYMILVGVINYFFFIKNKKFLEYSFSENKKGGYLILAYILFIAIVFVVLANINRARISNENVTEIVN
jgi:hypothetical protein